MEKMAVTEELPGVLVVIFIAGGVLTFLIVFIFGKRQIQRFALKNQKGPHVPVGMDARKALKREIERRLDRAAEVTTEPLLVSAGISSEQAYYYRMRAVDDARRLELEILDCTGTRRPPTDTMRRFLMSLRNSLLSRAGARAIHEFCDMYELARFDPAPFGRQQYAQMSALHVKLMESVQTQSGPSSQRSTPRARPAGRTPDAASPGRRPRTLSVPLVAGAGAGSGSETPV